MTHEWLPPLPAGKKNLQMTQKASADAEKALADKWGDIISFQVI